MFENPKTTINHIKKQARKRRRSASLMRNLLPHVFARTQWKQPGTLKGPSQTPALGFSKALPAEKP